NIPTNTGGLDPLGGLDLGGGLGGIGGNGLGNGLID
ncbi:sugar ABC transporter substrate-binding protein, partial [Salmonella enterica subsp. enterica serovar London]